MVLKDSLNKDETSKKLQKVELTNRFFVDSLALEDRRMKSELTYEKEILEKTNTRNIFMASGIILLVIAGGLWSRLNFTRKSKATLQVEKDRSENLLLNILPAEVAEELKQNGEAKARDFDMVTVIFTDFKGFTQTSEKLTANELVDELNYCFKGFDNIMEKFGIEKIKTIGDAYMAVGGLNDDANNASIMTTRAALEMQEFVIARKKDRDSQGLFSFEMRLGINSGPVVAGIVGVKKFQYDIWGDTVNTASRIESSGEVGRVNISKDTYEFIKDETEFTFTKRKDIKVKGKGEMGMYFVDSAAI
jgi:class 3 adenylate cyclase